MRKIGIIGHFGGDKEFYDGQTIKTKNLKKILEEYGKLNTYCVDTYFNKTNKVKLLIKTFLCLFKCKKIFILLSENGMDFYLPFLYKVNKLFRRKIFHYVIGSELLKMVEEKPKFVKYLNSLTVNWFEYQSGVEYLRKNGVSNAEVLPNCKVLTAVDDDECRNYNVDAEFRFCTFSRVMAEKGITDAILAVAGINNQRGKTIAKLDIYGAVDENYREEFERLCSTYSDYVAYKGLVESSKSVDVLKNYFALLFPTKWHGEGFPGTILDAFASGVPVIASDWNANKELIENGKTGIIYPSNACVDLLSSITWAIDNKNEFLRMRVDCYKEYEKYTPETISKKILESINK